MRKLTALLLFAFCLILPQTALAVSITINSAPSSVSSDPFNVDISVLGASAGQNYLRVDLYKDGSSNYFGQTYNGSDWYGGSTGVSYSPINIVDSKTTASASLQARIGTPTSGEYPGPGTYKLKIRRYTSSGNAAGSDDQSPVDVTINYSTPSTPTPTPKATSSTASSTKTSTSSVKTPTPTKIPTVAKSMSTSTLTNNSFSSSKGKQTVNNSDKIASDFARIQNPSPAGKSDKVSVLGESKKEFPYLSFMACGLLLLLAGAGIFAKLNWDKIKIWMENL